MPTYFLVLGRKRDGNIYDVWCEFESLKLEEANAKCRELNQTKKENTYKIETWTKMRDKNDN